MTEEKQITVRWVEMGGETAAAPWYALYTRPRHEKSVAAQLAERRIESFLPSYSKVHRWKDRKKEVCLPLFPGYLFVRICLQDRLRVLQLSGAVRFVGFNGVPALVPEVELQALRSAIESGTTLERCRYLKAGQRVRVCRGVLQGTEGVLIRSKGAHRLVLSIALIQRSVAVEVDASEVIPIAGAKKLGANEIRGSLGSIRTGMTQHSLA